MAASCRTSIFLLFSGPPLARSRPHSLAAGLQSSSPLLVATFPLALARTLGVASVQNPSLQQWFEYSAKSKKITCPVCKQRCASTNATRLYFQSTGDAVITQSRSVLDGLEESPGVLRLEVKKLESKVSVLKLTLDHHQEELKRINGELHLCKEQLSKEVTLKVEANLETKGANSVSTSNKIKCVFDDNGKLLGSASSSIQIWKEGDCIEQSSTDIWLAVCAAVRSACSLADVDGEDVTGIGFAATCSLVAVDDDGSPVTVSWSGDPRRNVIVWMDHRAVKQAERINSSDSPVLQYCGGALSPEMEPPKLLWVKENLKESWSMAFRWMDLSDWLSYKATGDDTRSLCTTVCKWTYLGHAHMDQLSENDSRSMEACGWDDEFWQEIGLGDLVDGHHAKIGRSVAFPGHPLGSGLTPAAAKEFGLLEGTPVGTSLIDAHAGGVGVMESVPSSDLQLQTDDKEAICHRMVLVCGTSTCHMAISKSKLFIPGVWGPFWSAMVPKYWLTEGGQSATGALLDYVVENHVASPHLANKAASRGTSVFTLLNKTLESMMSDLNSPFIAALTKDLHVLPDFHGNRSPIADPTAKGMVCGLTLDTSERNLALQYLATVQGIAYGTRHIVEHCNAHGHKIDTLLACGGLAKNPLYIQEHADITGYPVILPRENESVLLGAAILGAVAAKKYSSLHDAMKALSAAGQVIYPSKDPRVKKYHDAKYRIFRDLYEKQLSYRSIISEALS